MFLAQSGLYEIVIYSFSLLYTISALKLRVPFCAFCLLDPFLTARGASRLSDVYPMKAEEKLRVKPGLVFKPLKSLLATMQVI